jgi:spore germination cell wall hydrolase CwlJ-like protein
MTEQDDDAEVTSGGGWIRWLLLAIGIIVIVMLAVSNTGPESANPKRKAVTVALDQPVEPAPLTFQPDIAPADAEAINAERPDFFGSIAVARPFIAPRTADRAGDLQRAIECLTQTVYYEAASESAQGQRAVAQVVLNRVRDPNYPASVCGVVYQGSERRTGCQFTYTCDGSLARRPDAFLYARARMVAVGALAGAVEPSVGLATHYHTKQVVPYWRTDLVKLRTVGAHIFYGWKGREKSGRGLRIAYSGIEPIIAPPLPTPPGLTPDILPTIDPVENATDSPFAAPPLPDVGPRAPTLSTQDFGRMRADDARGQLSEGVTGGLEADRKAGTLDRN